MILSEFVLTHTKGQSPIDWVFYADVSVTTTTGVLWWKKKRVERRKIAREYDRFWRFVDNGQLCPISQAEMLAWTSQYFTKAMNGGEEAGRATFAMNAELYAQRQMK